jgi:hypothetical protein
MAPGPHKVPRGDSTGSHTQCVPRGHLVLRHAAQGANYGGLECLSGRVRARVFGKEVLNGVLAGVVLPNVQALWAPGVQGWSLRMCPGPMARRSGQATALSLL